MGNLLLSVLFCVFALQPLIINHSGTMNNTDMNVAPPVLLTWQMLFKAILVEKYNENHKMPL